MQISEEQKMQNETFPWDPVVILNNPGQSGEGHQAKLSPCEDKCADTAPFNKLVITVSARSILLKSSTTNEALQSLNICWVIQMFVQI